MSPNQALLCYDFPMKNASRQILITSALYYANGEIHLGHMVEATQADIWARFQRLIGNHCVFVSGDDAHGTAIMLAAEKQGIGAEEFIATVQAQHRADFSGFHIDFDHFDTTHSEENKKLCLEIYARLKQRGDISTKEVEQYFDPEKQLFLADRFIKGTCPKCQALHQYGDNCEACGATYSANELIDPYSTISGATPIRKTSLHYFFHLENHTDFLKAWLEEDHVLPAVSNKLKEWFVEGLQPWDISRDAPYFGFEIPDAPGKYFYVWLDAPIGYMASVYNLAKKKSSIIPEKYWAKDSKAELHHFIGKDIVYFHTLFWPAMLSGANFRTPSKVHVHGYLTINGEKMSKSRGTFITANCYLQHLNAEALRYYFAAKLNGSIEDIDLNLEDFMARVNSDLVGKYVNLASRTAVFIHKHFQGQLADTLHDQALFNEFVFAGESIATLFETLHYSHAMREIMALADKANQYIDHHKPWALVKEGTDLASVQAICTQGLNLFRVLTTYLKPVLPKIAEQVEAFLQCDALDWSNCKNPLLNHSILPFQPLLQRITTEQLQAITQ